MEALKSEAFYVGAIGSRLNNSRRRERLKMFDLTDEQIERLHGPIGLPIGSKTPAEIAISALAELTAAKNGAIERFLPLRTTVRDKGSPKAAVPSPSLSAQVGPSAYPAGALNS